MTRFEIGNKFIDENKSCFIIAEAGVNHNGSLTLAKKLVDVAIETGADAIKFQTFRAEDIVTRYANKADYQAKNENQDLDSESQFDMLKRLELSYTDFRELKQYCNHKGIIFLSTPHSSFKDVDFLDSIMIVAYKVGSGDLTNIPFLKYIANKGKPVILSTGMGNMKEVREAVAAMAPFNNQLILLHCTTNYPTHFEEVNLRAMNALREFDLPVGYSDHTIGIVIAVAAVALGASVIEKHFTLSRNFPGPDHKASLEPDELKNMVTDIRKVEERLKNGENGKKIISEMNIEKALGNGIKRPVPAELEIMKVARKSIVAATNIAAGSIITKDMLTIKRPGTGIKPKYLEYIIGKKTKRDINKDELIGFGDVI